MQEVEMKQQIEQPFHFPDSNKSSTSAWIPAEISFLIFKVTQSSH